MRSRTNGAAPQQRVIDVACALTGTASQSLIQLNTIDQALRLRCNCIDPDLLCLLLRDEQLQVTGRTQPVLPFDRLQGGLRSCICGCAGRQGLCVIFQRAQRVSDITQRLQYDTLVVRRCGFKSGSVIPASRSGFAFCRFFFSGDGDILGGVDPSPGINRPGAAHPAGACAAA